MKLSVFRQVEQVLLQIAQLSWLQLLGHIPGIVADNVKENTTVEAGGLGIPGGIGEFNAVELDEIRMQILTAFEGDVKLSSLGQIEQVLLEVIQLARL